MEKYLIDSSAEEINKAIRLALAGGGGSSVKRIRVEADGGLASDMQLTLLTSQDEMDSIYEAFLDGTPCDLVMTIQGYTYMAMNNPMSLMGFASSLSHADGIGYFFGGMIVFCVGKYDIRTSSITDDWRAFVLA